MLFLDGNKTLTVENIHSEGSGLADMYERFQSINGVNFINCSSREDGGVIYVAAGRINDCGFTNCASGEKGGGNDLPLGL